MKPILPIVGAVLGNVLYHLSQKLTPAQANPFLSIAVSFAVASMGCVILYAATARGSLSADLRVLTWTSVGLGLAVIAVETSFLFAYRSGWSVGLTSIVVTTSLALFLLPIGRVFFGERLAWTSVAGVFLSLIGLALISL